MIQIIYSDHLAHHGVKGMKWGVRRYQNYDGTRIKQLEEKEKTYSKKVKLGDDFKISKGDTLYRATNSRNETFDNRAYTTLTRSDAGGYAMSDVLGQPFEYIDSYIAIKDIKVAGYKTALKILSDSYNLEISEIPRQWYDVSEILEDTQKADVFMKNREDYQPYKDALLNNGYDAVVDLVDMVEFSDTPIILLTDSKIKKGHQYVSTSDEWTKFEYAGRR